MKQPQQQTGFTLIELMIVIAIIGMTGHLVLFTVHTNSAAETVTRLLNMGVPAFNIAASIAATAQPPRPACLTKRCCSSVSQPIN